MNFYKFILAQITLETGDSNENPFRSQIQESLTPWNIYAICQLSLFECVNLQSDRLRHPTISHEKEWNGWISNLYLETYKHEAASKEQSHCSIIRINDFHTVVYNGIHPAINALGAFHSDSCIWDILPSYSSRCLLPELCRKWSIGLACSAWTRALYTVLMAEWCFGT